MLIDYVCFAGGQIEIDPDMCELIVVSLPENVLNVDPKQARPLPSTTQRRSAS